MYWMSLDFVLQTNSATWENPRNITCQIGVYSMVGVHKPKKMFTVFPRIVSALE